jgi:hypothetical protein
LIAKVDSASRHRRSGAASQDLTVGVDKEFKDAFLSVLLTIIALHGPGATNLDARVFRDFRVRERMRMQFRAEVNVGNTPHFGVRTAILLT